jgi:hypothetical protein
MTHTRLPISVAFAGLCIGCSTPVPEADTDPGAGSLEAVPADSLDVTSADSVMTLLVEASRCPPNPITGDSNPVGPDRHVDIGPERSLVLRDCLTEGEAFVTFRYERPVPELGGHLIAVSYYEGGGWLFVNEEDGAQYRLLGVPELAPGGRHFAVASLDLVASNNPNRLEIWRKGGTLRRVFSLDGGFDWGPTSVQWVSADSLTFWRAWSEGISGGQITYDSTQVVVTRSRAGWSVSDSTGT